MRPRPTPPEPPPPLTIPTRCGPCRSLGALDCRYCPATALVVAALEERAR